MKKISICLLLSALFLFLSGTVGTKAATTATDNNETFMTATEITSKKPVVGQLADKDDKDWYKYKVESSSAFQLKFTSLSTVQSYWTISIYDSKANKLCDLDSVRDGFITITDPYCFEKGSDVYFVVTYYDFGYLSHCIGEDYQIEIIYLNDYNWEVESNDENSSATKIEAKNPRYGVMNNFGYYGKLDVDWYVYNIKDDNPFSFEITNTDPQNASWVIEFYDKDLKYIDKLSTKESDYITETAKFTYSKGDKIYIKIQNPEYGTRPLGLIYQLKVLDNSTDESDNFSEANVYSVLAGTNLVVGKADPGAKVSVKYGKKTYTATADANGIFRVKTAKLKKGKSITIWQTIDKKDSEKVTVKVVKKY